MIAYAKRENVFEKGERRWVVETGSLRQSWPQGGDLLLRWADVREIRLTYAPTRFKPWRHKLTLRGPAGAWVIDNGHYAGVGDFQDRSDSFGLFVLACVERVAAHAPGAVARLGSAPLAYWAQLLFVGAAFSLLALVVVAFPVNFSGLIWLKLLLVAAMLPVFLAFVVRSRPRRIALDIEAFRAALPKAAAG
jgi:hypothetical protein